MNETEWAKAIAATVKEYIEKHVEPLRKRVAELEGRKSFFYRGTWAEDEQYEVDDFVTFGGSVWHCAATTRQRPGDGNVWTLAVKHGRDLR